MLDFPGFELEDCFKQLSRDASDDMFLACALACRAQYLITRDADLLSLGKPFGIIILTDEQFLRAGQDASELESNGRALGGAQGRSGARIAREES